MKEIDLAERVIDYLQDMKWDVYQEVQLFPYGRIADIVAIRKPITMVVETKSKITIKALEQAIYWKHHSNYCVIATQPSEEEGDG